MKRFRSLVATALLAATVYAVPANARAGWTVLGTRSVGLFADHDVIPVTATRGDFRRVMLRAHGNGIFINSMTVTYSNGAPDRIPIVFYIPQGGQTRPIDLRGHNRYIRRVDLYYRRVPNSRGRAIVELWGRH